jgi:hypothetical protein
VVYCVVPRELEAELFERLTEHYADDPDTTVIVERRQGSRRARVATKADLERRLLRDRRRRRLDFAPLVGEPGLSGAA